ncbi:hypothetical protein M422DRAFT_276599 [Sphaerobolus stellatus SS14]|uniref:CCHC-type domain-containing protein n=1 Tax=Sphaerobolus stellatus (strain SS14) TaxID=990650 RepID=A0A0C9T2D5_SPHS4|nr:hypothetical protein M422DRAFT_276599 [Sphaerobolus stellatus SS14]
MSGKPAPFRYSSTPPPKETARDRRDHYEKSRGKVVEPLAKEPHKKRTPQVDTPTMSSTITMATVHEVNTSEEEHIQEEIDNEQLQSRTPMPVAGPSHDKGKQRAEPACDLMRDPNDSDPSSDSPSLEPERRKKKRHRKKKPKDSDSDDSGDDSDPSSSDDDRQRRKCKKRKHHHCHSNTDDDSDSDEDRVKKGAKIQDLDTFDGSNPEKLSSFFVSMRADGTALENFEPAVMADYPSREVTPLYLLYWEEFVYELQEHFGPVDMEEDTEEDLEDLKMTTNHRVTKYFVAFAKYKARTQFNNRGYYRIVKNMLPDHILDDLAKIWPKPKTYESLCQVVLQIDQCYWQTRHEESRRKARWGPTTSSTSTSTNNANSSNNSGSKSNKSRTLNNSKSKTTTVTVTNTSRHIDVGLCIVCGLKGHIAKDCNKARWNNNQASGSGSNNRPAPKARASNTEEKPNTDDKAKAKDSTSGLNASALSNFNSLTIMLTFESIPAPVYTLVDLGSKHCFVESKFVKAHSIPTYSIDPLLLSLFDGSINSVITEATDLKITFPSGETTSMMFYVTTLDSSCVAVLGHNWLTRYNLLIDWVLGSISFWTPINGLSKASSNVHAASTSVKQPLGQPCFVSVDSATPIPQAMTSTSSIPVKPSISFVNATAYMRAPKMEGSQCFTINLEDPEL